MDLSLSTLQEAVRIREEIDSLEERLRSLLSGDSADVSRATTPATSAAARGRGKRAMSPEARKRIAEAQRARWAKARATQGISGGSSPAKTSASKKRGISAAGRRKLSEMMKARWAARRKAAK